jgi:hypothetical protein
MNQLREMARAFYPGPAIPLRAESTANSHERKWTMAATAAIGVLAIGVPAALWADNAPQPGAPYQVEHPYDNSGAPITAGQETYVVQRVGSTSTPPRPFMGIGC